MNQPSSSSRPVLPSATWLAPGQQAEFEAAGTNAHRVASGPGGWVERLAEDALISYKDEAALEELAGGLERYQGETGWTASRVFVRFLPMRNAERIAPKLHSGDATLPLTSVVTENGVRFGIDLGAGYSHGLFLDQRLNRAKMRFLRPARLLNTFAYTCSFSVVAALAGAETVSMDLSQTSLDRGRRNLELNGVPDKGHRFVAGDAMALLPELARRREKFDAIILDPPTFSFGAQGRRWRVEDNLDELIDAALELAGPKCAILLSTNCTKLNPAELKRRAHGCIRGKRRAADFLNLGSPVDFPPGHGSSTVWMMVR